MKKVLLISMLFLSIVVKAQSINDTTMAYLEYYVKKDGIVVQKISPCIIIYEVVKRTLEMPYYMPPYYTDGRMMTSPTSAVTDSYREYMVTEIILDGKPFDLTRTHRIIENP